MVHLEEHHSYLERLRQSPTISLFVDEIFRPEVGTTAVNNADATSVALQLLRCIKSGNKELAASVYEQFATRVPTKESHWIHDEFVVFSLVCTVKKFGFSPYWISNVIHLTSYSAGTENNLIYSTFANILSGNLNVKGDFHQLSLVYQILASDQQLQDDRINKMLRVLWLKKFPFFNSDFLNLCSLRAIMIAFEVKALANPQELFLATRFTARFLSRTSKMAYVAAWLLLALVGAGCYWGLWKFNGTNPTLFGFITAASGTGVVGLFGLQKWLHKKLAIIIQLILGYKHLSDKG